MTFDISPGFDDSPATEATATPRPSTGLSSPTPVSFEPPRAPAEALRLLLACERVLTAPDSTQREQTIRQLARFLGANSAAWTLENRTRLHVLLSSLGLAIIEPLLDVLGRAPRTDVLDAAEAVLVRLPGAAAPRLANVAQNAHIVGPSVRALFLRAAVRLDFNAGLSLLATALSDASSHEMRAAAASLVGGQHDPRFAPLLRVLRSRESHADVRDALEEALEDSGGLARRTVAYFVRRTRYAVWAGPDRNQSQAVHELSRSDADTDGLSLFEVSTDEERDCIVAAIACERRNTDRVDLLEIDQELVAQLGPVSVTPDSGTTALARANELHRSLDWPSERLRALADTLFASEAEPRKYARAAVRQALGKVDLADIADQTTRAFVEAERNAKGGR